jgi:tetratricopeptide (TPR) repeat protein
MKKVKILSPFCNNCLVTCLIGALLLSGCSTTPTSTREVSGQKPEAPADLPGNYDKARVLMQSGDYRAAIPVLLDFIDKNPELAGPCINLGIAYQHTEQDEAAMDAVRSAVELDPASATAHHQLGILYRQQGDFESALDAYKNALKLDAGYPLVHRNIGILYDLYLGQPALALEHYRKYLELAAEPDPSVNRWVVDLERRGGSAQARTDQ